MSLRDDLVAARALIDTEATWENRGIVLTLVKVTDGNDSRYAAARSALLDGKWTVEALSYMQHPDIMAVFDRAIEAAK